MRIAINSRRLLTEALAFGAIGLFLGVLNPFGSVTGQPAPVGFGYWMSLVVWGGLAAEGLAWLLRRLAPGLPIGGYLIALSGLMTVAIFPAVALEQALVLHLPIPLGDLPRFVFYVWLIALSTASGAVLGFRAVGLRSGLDPNGLSGPTASAPIPPPSPFLERLPLRLRQATLYAVESEDHYLRVHTSAGQELILMRLADAVRELAGRDGLQTHRSWWVAADGLADAARQKGRVVLKLKSGIEAPVSRTYAAAVKDKGWI